MGEVEGYGKARNIVRGEPLSGQPSMRLKTQAPGGKLFVELRKPLFQGRRRYAHGQITQARVEHLLITHRIQGSCWQTQLTSRSKLFLRQFASQEGFTP